MKNEGVTYKAVIYTDGSGVNQKEYGCGAHGYLYTEENANKKNNDKPSTHYITNIGYVTAEEKPRVECFEVKPTRYLNIAGSYVGDGTSNMGELLAIVETLDVLNNDIFLLEEVMLLSDSTYAIGMLSKMLNNDNSWDSLERPNLGILKRMSDIVKTYQLASINISIVKVKGHSDDIGNHYADRLAYLGRINTARKEVGIKYAFTEGKFWRLETPKHPLLNVKNIFFANEARDVSKYIIMDYPTDVDLGKKSNESLYGVVIMNKPDDVLEGIMSTFNANMKTLSVLANVNVREAYSPYHIINKDVFGQLCYTFDKRRQKLNVMDNLEVATAVTPPGLARQAYSKTLNLHNILNSYLSNTKADTREFHDVTDTFFGKDSKGKTISILENGVNVTDVVITLGKVKHTIPLMLGVDIVPRNNIKKLEKLEPKITIVTDNITGKIIEHYVIIETVDSKAIYCNFYANKIFI